MGKYPVLAPVKVVALLRKIGFVEVRQKGSTGIQGKSKKIKVKSFFIIPFYSTCHVGITGLVMKGFQKLSLGTFGACH